MTLTFTTTKTPDFIFDYLTDMQKFASVHPVISKIKHISGNAYKVYETLKFAGIPFSFTYTVLVESDATTKQVSIKATVMKLTKVNMLFVVSPHNTGAVVSEEITFKTPLPVKSLLASIFKKQHTQFFKNTEDLN